MHPPCIRPRLAPDSRHALSFGPELHWYQLDIEVVRRIRRQIARASAPDSIRRERCAIPRTKRSPPQFASASCSSLTLDDVFALIWHRDLHSRDEPYVKNKSLTGRIKLSPLSRDRDLSPLTAGGIPPAADSAFYLNPPSAVCVIVGDFYWGCHLNGSKDLVGKWCGHEDMTILQSRIYCLITCLHGSLTDVN